MKNYVNLSILITLLAVFLDVGHTNVVFACSPPAGPIATTTPQQFFEGSTHVFSGKVLSIENGSYIATSTFEVLKYWKGDVKKYTKVIGINNSAGCQSPYPFVVGEEYLVYATYSSYNNVLITGQSPWGEPGTQPLKDAGAHLTVLGQGSLPSPMVNPFHSPVVVNNYIFLHDLRIGSKGEDVRNLQRYLNGKGFIISTSGLGSPSNESDYFGSLTKAALIKFQNNYRAQLGIPQGTGYFGPLTRNLIQTLGN